MKNATEITKLLSINDTGENKSHQAGILIPKTPPEILNFFPTLDVSVKNPRIEITFMDDNLKKYIFNFIYYNNKQFNGTRDEYRLTGMTEYLRINNLKAGDEIHLKKRDDGMYLISYLKRDRKVEIVNEPTVIKLKNKWRLLSL